MRANGPNRNITARHSRTETESYEHKPRSGPRHAAIERSELMGVRVRSGVIVVLGVAALTALFLPGLGSVAAAAAAPGPSWPSQVARPAPASCPAGQTLIAPTSGQTDALGVTHLSYRSDPRLVASIPPRGLTSSRVTPAVLADLGMHLRGTSASAERRAAGQVISLARDRAAPEFCYSPAPDQVNAHFFSANWAGYEVTESEFGGEIDGVTGSWAVPYSDDSTPEPSEESTWVGIGGDIGGEGDVWGLIQAGTKMQYNEGFRSWWEYLGTSGCAAPTFCGQYSSVDAISQGEQVTADVWWDTSETATFLVSTGSGGGDYDITNYPVNTPYDHTSGEWIDESYPEDEIDYNGVTEPYYYDDPGTVYFSDQRLTGGFGGQGAYTSPFLGSFQASIMQANIATSSTSINCSNPSIVSYPADTANTPDGGSSEIITCDVPGYDAPG
jgi:hypothetical protein